LRDINANLESEVEKRTEELIQARLLLERSERLASLGTLAAGIAHEINNPLTGIILHTSLAMNETSELGKGDLERVEKEARRCSTIVQRLLTFARSDNPKTSPASLKRVVAESAELASVHNAMKQVMVELPENDVTVIADQQKLIQVLVNILINAGQAMDGSGIIHCSIEHENRSAVLDITDEGKGMTEEELNRVFEPFYTTKEDGTGLGLAVSYGIIQGHGGTIRLTSQAGKGTSVRITLPTSTENENMFLETFEEPGNE
jgi:two-component system NtrC family sensor kinase